MILRNVGDQSTRRNMPEYLNIYSYLYIHKHMSYALSKENDYVTISDSHFQITTDFYVYNSPAIQSTGCTHANNSHVDTV